MLSKKFNRINHYSYSNTRVKAMKSKLLNKEILDDIARLNNIPQILAVLLKTDYKENIEKYGNIEIETEMIDYSLNQSLSDAAEKLVRITPNPEKTIIESIVSKWDMYNIKLIIHAKATNKSYEEIKQLIIKSKKIPDFAIKEALNQNSFYDTINELSSIIPYKKLLTTVNEVYKKTSDIVKVEDTVDKYFFDEYSKIVPLIEKESKESAKIIKLDIEIRNILMLIRAKKYDLDEAKLKELLTQNGVTSINNLIELYKASKNFKELIEGITTFNLADIYKKYENPSLFDLEIYMKKIFFKKINSLIAHSVLSIGAIIEFYYLKDFEISILRALINSKKYNLKDGEIMEMIEWRI
ncbi:MAG: V-type ATPase subunit [Candidatus Micrarchaeia archaeon]